MIRCGSPLAILHLDKAKWWDGDSGSLETHLSEAVGDAWCKSLRLCFTRAESLRALMAIH